MSCKTNTWIVDGFSLVFQVVLIFAFLTIFFFVYVVKVEQTEFKDQMIYVVDNILTKDIERKILGPVNHTISQEQLVALLSGIIDGVEYQTSKDDTNAIKNINTKNNSIRHNAFKTLGIILGIVIILTIIMLISGYCIPVLHQTIEALWVVLFIAITEFTFLQVVAKKYKSADPNKVKRTLGNAITTWIKKNKKI